MASFNNQGLDHVAIGVEDVERSRAFYADVLGFERTHEEWDVPLVMSAPGTGTGIAIFDKELHPSPTPDGADPPAVRILHVAFRVDREGFDAARSELPRNGVPVHFSDHGLSHSIYLRDPDGHQIELTTYEV
jgi:catechol 2,3-dioxygenase-like lactoylglutathione lyase family enzyme